MSNRHNNLAFPVAIAVIIFICIGLVKVIIDTINNTFNPQLENGNNVNNRIKQSVSRSRRIASAEPTNTFNTRSEDGNIYATVVLSSDDTLMTFTVNAVTDKPLRSVQFLNGDSEGIIISDVQETETGYMINSMWANFNEPPFASNHVDDLRKGNMYIILNFDDMLMKGQLLAATNIGSLKNI